MKIKRGNGSVIEIEDNPIAKGGQGSIHKIISPYYTNPLVSKLYFDALKSAQIGSKNKKVDNIKKRVEFMVQNNPFINSPKEIKEAFIWPIDTLYDLNNNFIGFLMPFINQSIELTKITINTILPTPWDKFQISNKDSYNVRLKVCYNVAQAIAEMHKSNTYTLVDFKPQNMMLLENGFVKMIDMDSIQISKNNKILFGASVRTPEFSPPEDHLKRIDFSKDYIDQNWDCYSFGVFAYIILLNIHPFMGITHKTHQNINSYEEYLKLGYFPQGNRKSDLSIADPHLNFDKLLSKNLQTLFIKCFEDGYLDPSQRPTMVEWKNALIREITNIQNKQISAGINQPKPQKKHTPNKNGYPNTYAIVLPISIINSFTISPAGPNLARIEWKTSNTSYARLNNSNVSANGNIIVPVDNSTYFLEAIDHYGNSVNSILHTGIYLKINSFNYNIISNGVVFDWNVSGANLVKLNGQPVSLNGTIQHPLEVGIQTLEAVDSNGFIITSQLNIVSVAKILDFKSIINRHSVFVEWDTLNVVNAKINGLIVPSNGKNQIPVKTSNYTLEVKDKFGYTLSQRLDINISPSIKQYQISYYKHYAELSWDVWYATECKLNGQLISESGLIKVPLFNKEYYLEVCDEDGNVEKQSIFVKCSEPCQLIETYSRINKNLIIPKQNNDFNILKMNQLSNVKTLFLGDKEIVILKVSSEFSNLNFKLKKIKTLKK